MILKRILYDIKSAIIKGYPFLICVYVYYVCSSLYLFFNEVTDYVSVYTSSLFVSFALCCIACRDMNLKIVRFDFQFRMTFVYLVLLLISWFTISVAPLLDGYNGFKEVVSDLFYTLFPNMQYELVFKYSLELVVESLFYGLLCPLIYLFATLSFNFKKLMSFSFLNWMLGVVLITFNGVVFGVIGLLVQLKTNLYLYTPIFSVECITLIVLSYVVGKNSFAEVPNH